MISEAEMTDHTDLIARLGSINPRALYSAIAKDSINAIQALQGENDRLREELAAAQKEMAAPGGKLQPQLLEAIHDCERLDGLLQSVIAGRTEAWRLVGEHEAESRRLRTELAAAQKDAEQRGKHANDKS